MLVWSMKPSFFEGPEKKVELVVHPKHPSLRSWSETKWRTLVQRAKAEILSVLRNEHCDAYLLSESSLFVYDDHLTMITCGRTTLVDAALQLIEWIGPQNIALLIYERKNEHFPERQLSTFYEDAQRLHSHLAGRAYRFGDEHDHHIHMFCASHDFSPEENDTTLEILMHGLPANTAERFVGCTPLAKTMIAQSCGITSILPRFQIDEHAFTPAGYSMNGLRGKDYYTIHVTPESLGSYVSFETNVDFRGTLANLVSAVVDLFQPRSFDVLAFVPSANSKEQFELSSYRIKDRVMTTSSGYDIRYWHCYRPIHQSQPPSEIVLPSN